MGRRFPPPPLLPPSDFRPFCAKTITIITKNQLNNFSRVFSSFIFCKTLCLTFWTVKITIFDPTIIVIQSKLGLIISDVVPKKKTNGNGFLAIYLFQFFLFLSLTFWNKKKPVKFLLLSWWKINVCSHIHFSAFSFLLWSACTHRVCCQLVRYLHVSCRIRENSFPPQGFSHFCRFFHRVTIRIECESLHRIETDLFYAVKFAFVGVTHKHRFHGVLRKKEIFGRSTSSLTTYPGFLFFSFFWKFSS